MNSLDRAPGRVEASAGPRENALLSSVVSSDSRKVPISVVDSTNPPRLAKRFRLVDDVLVKEGAGNMSAGSVRTVEVPRPVLLAELLGRLQPNQGLIFGVNESKAKKIVSKGLLGQYPAAIARTSEHFRWNVGPGWMMLDYDPAPDTEPLSREKLLDQLFTTIPALRDAPAVWGPSASSEIWNSETGEQLAGIKGQRLYILVEDARDIPRAGKALFDRLWLAGHGHYQVSKSGALLKRGPIDASVWQTNRLDFAAPPVCEAPLETRRSEPLVFNDEAAPLPTMQAIPDLTESETKRLSEIYSDLAGNPDLVRDRKLAQDAWIDERLESALDGDERDALRQRLRAAVQKCRLFGDFSLIHSSNIKVTVGELLNDPERWHGERFADPLEPTYSNNDHRIAYANLRSGGAPSLYSHAHGGQTFRLLRASATLRIQGGELPHVLPQVFQRLHLNGEVYERGGRLVRVADGALMEVGPYWLKTNLETSFSFENFDRRSKEWRVKDCSDDLVRRILQARGAWGLPKVAGVVSFPILRPDGSLLDRGGYDEKTQLLLLDEKLDQPTPVPLDGKGLQDALERIWAPFAEFPFVDDLSRGVFFSALLTTVCRAGLPTAPGFLIRAHVAGTGKSLLSECLMVLVGARPTAMPLPQSNEEEIEKRLFAKLLTAAPGLVLDNLVGVLDNAAMCAFLTSAEPEGRILGKSETPTIVNRTLFVLNGNNVTAGGDTFRRLLPVSLDACTETPEIRKFTFNPRELIKQRLDDYRADLLSVLLTYQAAGAPEVGKGALGSFEDWERLVRQAVCWLINEQRTPVPMADPVDALKLSRGEDPMRQERLNALSAWFDYFGDSPVLVAELTALMQPEKQTGSLADRLGAAQQNLREVLGELTFAHRGSYSSGGMAGWLRVTAGQVIGGFRLETIPGTRASSWRVTRDSAM